MADAAEDTLATRFQVDWQSMTMSNLIDQDECSSIQHFQQTPLADIQERINSEPQRARELGRALVRLVHITANPTGVALACALSSIVLSAGRHRVELFKGADDLLPVQDFVRVLTADNSQNLPNTQLDASRVIASFLSGASSSQLANFPLDPLLQWLNTNLRHDTSISPNNAVALRCAGALFRSRALRLRFLDSPGTDLLCDYIKQKATNGLTAEVLYRATFCLWSLSYHDEAIPAVCAHNIVGHLITRNLPHMDDKIARLGLSTLVNFLNKEDAEQGVQLNDVRPYAAEGSLACALVGWLAAHVLSFVHECNCEARLVVCGHDGGGSVRGCASMAAWTGARGSGNTGQTAARVLCCREP